MCYLDKDLEEKINKLKNEVKYKRDNALSQSEERKYYRNLSKKLDKAFSNRYKEN